MTNAKSVKSLKNVSNVANVLNTESVKSMANVTNVKSVKSVNSAANVTNVKSPKSGNVGDANLKSFGVKHQPFASSLQSAVSNPKFQRTISIILTGVISFPIAMIMTRSIVMATAISTVALVLPIEMSRLSYSKRLKLEREAWPVAIDHLISAVGSGISLNQAIYDLADRGPDILTPQFQEIKRSLQGDTPFQVALREGKRGFRTSAADQVLEVLIIARITGSSNVGNILRTLGEFLRQENAMRAEVEARHGWVRSSASLAAIAPWVLLVILSAQPTTRAAFTSVTGLYILIAGVGMTAIAYIWMNLVGRLPEVPRALY